MKNYFNLLILGSCIFALISCGTGSSEKSKAPGTKVDLEKVFSTELATAAAKGDLELVKKMVEAGVDINQTTSFGETALMQAAQNGHVEIVKYLLSKKADLYKENVYGYDVSVFADDSDNEEIIELIKTAMKNNPKE